MQEAYDEEEEMQNVELLLNWKVHQEYLFIFISTEKLRSHFMNFQTFSQKKMTFCKDPGNVDWVLRLLFFSTVTEDVICRLRSDINVDLKPV